MKEIEGGCSSCEPPEERAELCLLGLDVVALFPSMSAKKTGEILRMRMMKSSLNVKGFDWRRGLVYIVINKHLTNNLGKLWKILPYRKKVGGTVPGMMSQAMQGKKDLEEQWVFKCREVDKDQLMEIVGRCLEIAMRTVFENFSYRFGGKTFLQKEGGPIGNRLTMACSRVVMTDWGEKYLRILDKAAIVTTLLKIYVDDADRSAQGSRMG